MVVRDSVYFAVACIELADYDLSMPLTGLQARFETRLAATASDPVFKSPGPFARLGLSDFGYLLRDPLEIHTGSAKSLDSMRERTLRDFVVAALRYIRVYWSDNEIGWALTWGPGNPEHWTSHGEMLLRDIIASNVVTDRARLCAALETLSTAMNDPSSYDPDYAQRRYPRPSDWYQ